MDQKYEAEFDQHFAEESEEELQQRYEQEMAERLSSVGHSLQALADDTVKKRRGIEDRWMEDMRQLNGQYDAATAASLKASGGSQVYVNITRKMANAAESRLLDILFPSDDRNWGIQPTPVPYLSKMATDDSPMEIKGQPVITDKGIQVQKRDMAAGALEEARERADAMQTEIHDQLQEADYNVICRDVVRQGVQLGAGVLKGPIVTNSTKQAWVPQVDELGNEVHVLNVVEELRPHAERVDVWDFFPDMSARTIDDAEFVFQRHYMTKKDLRNLSKQPGFLKQQIAAVMKSEADPMTTATHLEEMRSMSGISDVKNSRYEVWEYHGPLKADELRACGCEIEEDEIFDEVMAVVWFTENHVLKAVINPSDTEEFPFSVFNWETDDTGIFGFGIASIMRDTQRVMNATWRMVMDNGALSTGPQVVIDKSAIKPENGSWSLTGRKVWVKNDPHTPIGNTFQVFGVDGHTNELLALFQFARNLADEETSIPQIAQGEQGDASDTYNGMKILMNSANTMMRRVVKNYDDAITRPHIKRMYDWNMQFNAKEDIKGDFNIDARGASSLLVKEEQARNLMTLVNMAASPLLQPYTNMIELYRKVVSSMQLPADTLIKTDEEIKTEEDRMKQQQETMLQAQANNGDPMAQQQLELQAQRQQLDAQIKQLQIQTQQQKLELDREKMTSDRELKMAGMALEEGLKMNDLKTRLGMKKLDVQSKNTLFDKEAHLKLTAGSGI